MIPSAFRARLAVALTNGGSETSVFLNSLETMAGESITFSNFSPFTRGVITVDPEAINSSQPEFISFTGITTADLELTGITRGLSSLSNSVVSDNVVFHPVGTPVIIAWGGHNIQDLIDYMNAVLATASFGVANVTPAMAGENLTAGNVVYLKNDGKWWKTTANTASTVNNVELGIAQATTAANNTISGGVMKLGLDTHQSGLTPGATYYISNTAGAISSSPGTTSKAIGVAKTTTDLNFDPYYNSLITADQAAAMAGGGALGTPSSSNKYLTQAVQIVCRTYNLSDSPATWTKPAGLAFIDVELWGGGGGGGTGAASSCGGGGGGGYLRRRIYASQLGATETITIGAGGAADTNGSNTTFGTLATAYGGGAGGAAAGSGAAGNGTSPAEGGGGGGGSGGGGAGGAGGGYLGGAAGNNHSYFGGGGGGTIGATAGSSNWGGGGGGGRDTGVAGSSVYGGGGGGTVSGAAGTSTFGGSGGAGGSVGNVPSGGGGRGAAGAAGQAKVTEYYSS